MMTLMISLTRIFNSLWIEKSLEFYGLYFILNKAEKDPRECRILRFGKFPIGSIQLMYHEISREFCWKFLDRISQM